MQHFAQTQPSAAADATDIHRNAYNAAFYELGLAWHWDENTYQALLPNADCKDRIRVYMEAQQPHLLKAYDAEFLAEVIETAKERCYENMAACTGGKASQINWAAFQCAQVGV